MSPTIGIDLGTTNSLIAVLGDQGPQVLRNLHGDHLTPSVVHIDADDRVLVGKAARERGHLDAGRTATQFKRSMGTSKEYMLGNKFYSSQMLSGLVLQALKRDAESLLGQSVDRAVISVPAYFNDAQRQATKDAAELAGIEVVRMLNEPTAAALAYGLHLDAVEKCILVFDLGGGTFDVTVLEYDDGLLEVHASAGEAFLGGEDFTDALLAHVLEPVGLSPQELLEQSPLLHARLRRKVEEAKLALSDVDSVEIPMPDFTQQEWRPRDRVHVTRAELEQLAAPILERMKPVLRRALSDAAIDADEIDEVLLVGGATRMPCISRFLEEHIGKPPRAELDPDLVVAEGAAIQAGLVTQDSAVQDIVVTDVMPHTIGVEVVKEFGNQMRQGYFMPIIHRNTTIPTSRTDIVSTVHHNQTVMEIIVYQGESRLTSKNLELGTLEVKGIPPGPKGQESIEVRFTYDLNGLLQIDAKITSTGKVQSHLIEQRPGRLDPKARAAALKAMEKLKVHPRDEVENRYLLDQGMRLFAEQSGLQRDRLGELLDLFEDALERRDDDLIPRIRDELSILLSLLEGGDPPD